MVRTQQEIIAAQAWRDALKAYYDEADKYVGAAWLATDPPPDLTLVKELTPKAWHELMRLRQSEQDALKAFREVAGTDG